MSKPEVKIKEWGIYRRHTGENPWALCGKVIDHPRFEEDTPVTTSSIIGFNREEMRELQDGDRVETRNTYYVLVGNNENGSN